MDILNGLVSKTNQTAVSFQNIVGIMNYTDSHLVSLYYPKNLLFGFSCIVDSEKVNFTFPYLSAEYTTKNVTLNIPSGMLITANLTTYNSTNVSFSISNTSGSGTINISIGERTAGKYYMRYLDGAKNGSVIIGTDGYLNDSYNGPWSSHTLTYTEIPSCDNPITSCCYLNSSNTAYTLGNDIYDDGSFSIGCLIFSDGVTALENVSLDCLGKGVFNSTDVSSRNAIMITGFNDSVRNCNVIGNYNYGIDSESGSVDYLSITDNNLTDVSTGIYINAPGSYMNLSENIINTNGGTAIYIGFGSGDSFYNNSIYSGNGAGFYLMNGNNNTFSFNYVETQATYDSYSSGIYIDLSETNDTLFNNTIYAPNTVGISLGLLDSGEYYA